MLNALLLLLSTSAFFQTSETIGLGVVESRLPAMDSRIAHHRNGEEYSIEELMTFDLTGWETSGNVSIVPECYKNASCIRIGRIDNPGEISSVKTEIVVANERPSTLKLDVRSNTSEYLAGFDAPVFLVSVDGVVIYWENASVPLNSAGEWRQIFALLPQLEPGKHVIEIFQIDTGDAMYGTEIDIGSAHTSHALLGRHDTLEISAFNPEHLIVAEIDNGEFVNTYEEQGALILTSDELNPTAEITYWVHDQFGRRSNPSMTQVSTDLISPLMSESLSSFQEDDGSYILRLPRSDTDISSYQIREIEAESNSDYKIEFPILTTTPYMNNIKHKSLMQGISEDFLKIPHNLLALQIRVVDFADNHSNWQEILLE